MTCCPSVFLSLSPALTFLFFPFSDQFSMSWQIWNTAGHGNLPHIKAERIHPNGKHRHSFCEGVLSCWKQTFNSETCATHTFTEAPGKGMGNLWKQTGWKGWRCSIPQTHSQSEQSQASVYCILYNPAWHSSHSQITLRHRTGETRTGSRGWMGQGSANSYGWVDRSCTFWMWGAYYRSTDKAKRKGPSSEHNHNPLIHALMLHWIWFGVNHWTVTAGLAEWQEKSRSTSLKNIQLYALWAQFG